MMIESGVPMCEIKVDHNKLSALLNKLLSQCRNNSREMRDIKGRLESLEGEVHAKMTVSSEDILEKVKAMLKPQETEIACPGKQIEEAMQKWHHLLQQQKINSSEKYQGLSLRIESNQMAAELANNHARQLLEEKIKESMLTLREEMRISRRVPFKSTASDNFIQLRESNEPVLASPLGNFQEKTRKNSCVEPAELKMIQHINAVRVIEYAMLCKKIDQVEEHCKRIENRPLDIVSYASSLRKKSLPCENEILLRLKGPQPNQESAIFREHLSQCEQFESKISRNLNNFKKQIEEKCDRMETISDKFPSLLRKITSLGGIEKQMKHKMDTLLKIQAQENSIAEVKAYFKEVKDLLHVQEMRKISINKCLEDVVKLNQNIAKLMSEMPLKANKEQVKQAFDFIEAKIKEIVVVIAGNFKDQKIGSLSKFNLRCLICDMQTGRLVPCGRECNKTGDKKLRRAIPGRSKENRRLMTSTFEQNKACD